MGARGTKSTAQKVVALRKLSETDLPPAPKHLSKEAQQEWNEIVARYPSDRFPRAVWPMLEGYCGHAVHQRIVAKKLDRVTEETPVRDYNMLLMMFDRESKAVASFGVRLGIARTSMGGRHNNDPDTVRDDKLPWEED